MKKPGDYVTEMFHKLREDISEIKHKLFTEKPKLESVEIQPHYTIDAIYKDEQSHDKDDKAIRATLNLPPSIRVDAKTEERKRPWIKDRAVLLQIGTMAIGILVAVIYGCQLREMIKSNQLTKQALVVSQGPQVYVVQTKLLTLKANEKAKVETEIKNFGHLGAEEFSLGTLIDIRQGNPLPSISMDEPSGGVGLPPEVPTYNQIESREALSKTQVDDITLGKQTLYIYGVLQYQSPLEPGLIKDIVFCSKYDPTNSNALFIGCSPAPNLLIGGKPLKRTREPQQHP
jgi:hypothetical protein